MTWTEAQHGTGPKHCGNFNVCDKGSSFFFCGPPLNESTAHGVLPVPFPGQTITILRCDGVRVLTPQGAVHKHCPNIDNTTSTLTAKTSTFVPFCMGAFAGRHETIDLQRGEQAHVLRNFDGRQGTSLAAALEGCYGLEVLEGGGTGAKCAAAMGNNCQDDYRKLYPSRMFLDDSLVELMRPLLDGCFAAVNAHSSASAHQPLSWRHGARTRYWRDANPEILH